MAVDDIKTEWHLTPSGWVRGTSRFFGKLDSTEINRPADAVETWLDSLHQQSGWSKEEKSWRMIWSEEAISLEERDRIRRLFPSPVR